MYFRDKPVDGRPTSRSHISGMRTALRRPNKWRCRWIPGDMAGVSRPAPLRRPNGNPVAHRNFQDNANTFLRDRPKIRGVQYSDPPAVECGDFAKHREIWRNSHRIAPLFQERSGGPRNPIIAQESLKIFLHHRPHIHGERNSALSPQLGAASLARLFSGSLARAPSCLAVSFVFCRSRSRSASGLRSAAVVSLVFFRARVGRWVCPRLRWFR